MRMAIFGQRGTERAAIAAVLRLEAEKIDSSWRKRVIIEDLLPKNRRTASHNGYGLYLASLIRDDHFNNLYFKIDLKKSQTSMFSVLLLAVLASILAVLSFTRIPPAGATNVAQVSGTAQALGNGGTLPHETIIAAAAFGILGSLFSAVLSTAKLSLSGRIPEQIADTKITIARIGVGATAAVMAVFLLQLGQISIREVSAADPFLILVVSFAAGFSEQLVVRALRSFTDDGK
jgi:hypothetical protein